MSWQRPLIAVIVIGLTALLVALLGSPPAPALAAVEHGTAPVASVTAFQHDTAVAPRG